MPKEELELEEQTEEEEENLKEVYFGIISFEDLDAEKAAHETALKISGLTDAYVQMVENIMFGEYDNKAGEIERLSGEFIVRLRGLQEMEERKAIEENEEDTVELTESAEITGLSEGDTGPLHAVVRVIKPGWGNKTHNHYYPKDILQRDAHRFIGAKMYETDHRPQEKSTRTWVSTVEDIVGFDDGAPLAKVAVHDTSFGERLKNLDKLGMLEKMECSIYANGLAKKGFKLDGREGKQVESITSVSSVDWVTRAGAGGAAVRLLESEELSMEKEEEKTPEVEEVVETEEELAEDVEPVEIVESEEEKELSVERVKEILAETSLPKSAQTRLAFTGRFSSEEDVKELAEAEIEYLKEITRAGKPFAMKKSEKPQDNVDKFAEAEKRKDDIAKKIVHGK